MHDDPTDAFAAQLSALLPYEAQPHARPFAQMISAVAAGTALPDVLQAYLAGHQATAAGTVQALAGHTIAAGSAVVAFGSGNDFGQVSIGQVAGGNINNVTVNLFGAGATTQAGLPDPLQWAILARIAQADARGAHSLTGEIAASVESSADVVADELELLEQAGYVQSQRLINGTRYRLTAAGRKLLRTMSAT